MVTELIIVLTLFFILASTLVGNLHATFNESAPKLGAKIEKYLETGVGFTTNVSRPAVTWRQPPGPPP